MSIREASDLSAFDWIERGIRSPVHPFPEGDVALRVVDLIPPRYEAYAKIFHSIYEQPIQRSREPTWDESYMDQASAPDASSRGDLPEVWRSVPWSEVARELGVPYSAEMSEYDIDRAWRQQSWPTRLVGPDEGNLCPGLLGALQQAIEQEGDPGDCNFWWTLIACMRFPERRDRLFRGRLGDLPRFLESSGFTTPSYWWPEDRAWCVATDRDLCFSVLGGPATLVRRVLESPKIEGLAVRPDGALLFSHRRK